MGGKPPERVNEMPGGVNSETRAYRCPTAGDSDAVSRSKHTSAQTKWLAKLRLTCEALVQG